MKTLAARWRRIGLFAVLAVTLVGSIWGYLATRVDPVEVAQMQLAGRELFVRNWEPNDPRAGGDGLGPVFNAKSCVACHFQGGVGGGGDAAHNVTGYEVHPTVRVRYLQTGLVHAFATDPKLAESQALVRDRFPVIPGGDKVIAGCTVHFEDFDPLRMATTNSIALFGDGLIDDLSESKVRLNYARKVAGQLSRELSGDFKSVGTGRPRTLPDGRLGKFGWKAQFATVEEFVAAACANELGLGNPLMPQAKPLGKSYQCDESDLSREEFRQLVAFVDAIPRPVEVLPKDSRQRTLAERGKTLFTTVGCAECHTPDLGNVAGIYSDLLLHRVSARNSDGYQHDVLVDVPLPTGHPEPDEWRTPPLWGVADSAPYFHDGGSATLEAAILRHDGGARVVTNAFLTLPAEDQQAVIAFLKTLRAPADGPPSEALLAANTATGQ